MADSETSQSPAANPDDSKMDTSENPDRPANSIESTVTPQEQDAMNKVLTNVYAYRIEDDYDPSKVFHRKVNKRMVPDYFDVIKEPRAMSYIKTKVNGREYKTFEEFVRDFALICFNAQVYNSSSAQAYQDAITIKNFLEKELAALVAEGIISKAKAELPYLGELPPPDEPAAEEAEDDDDDDDEDEEDEEDDSEDESKKKRKRGRPSLASKREREGKEKEEDPDARKKRGRPPRVDTPMEARIKNIMKGLRKPKNTSSELMIGNFERLPDKAALPEYFKEIKQPMALDIIKKKLKRKKYNSVDVFMRDVELMFENAKQYNQDESQIYKEAMALQKEARQLADFERNRPDTDFVMEDGRIPLPSGILHNGEVWKVGDWVHIQNPNDLTKPIVAQIYRTYQDQDGAKWINACWYYRPEQTIHRFDKHFFENEVVKTGQYRDHPIDDIVDRCFVMFFTRFNKGRPRNFPADKEVYVCEARYNEEKHKINKIKTWASCLPDEVRDKDYEMDLFDLPRKLKKVPSPLKYLFKEGEQKPSDDIPKPVWGAPNAPPSIGAVHCRPRDPKESPPPEPTPSPPPAPPPAPLRQMSSHQTNGLLGDRPSNINIAAANNRLPLQPAQTPQPLTTPSSYTPNHTSQYHHTAATPTASHPGLSRGATFGGIGTQNFNAQSHSLQYGSGFQQPSHTAAHQQHRNPAQASGVAYKAPNPIEVWHLPGPVNFNIPADIRNQFHTDAQGHVLFYTAPPIAAEVDEKTKLKHSPAYLAFRARQQKETNGTKRGADEDAATSGAEQEGNGEAKRAKTIAAEKLVDEALTSVNNLLADATVKQFKQLYGEEGWSDALRVHLDIVAKAQEAAGSRLQERKRVELA